MLQTMFDDQTFRWDKCIIILSNAEFSFAVSLIPPTFNIYLERNCSRDIFFFKSWFYIVHFYRFVNFVQSGQFH